MFPVGIAVDERGPSADGGLAVSPVCGKYALVHGTRADNLDAAGHRLCARARLISIALLPSKGVRK